MGCHLFQYHMIGGHAVTLIVSIKAISHLVPIHPLPNILSSLA